MTRSIDLNADLGEGAPYDEAILALVSSANIACGGHVGDASSMRACLELAKRYGVNVGAHPSYPDKENFGRRTMAIGMPALQAALIDQLTNLAAIAAEVGVPLRHVKPHGALYNDASASAALADNIAQCVSQNMPGLALLGPPNSALQYAAVARGIRFVAEGFADRAYVGDGTLAPRSMPGAVLTAPSVAARQAVELARGLPIATLSDGEIELAVDTICLHGDDQGALDRATAVHAALVAADIGIESCPS